MLWGFSMTVLPKPMFSIVLVAALASLVMFMSILSGIGIDFIQTNILVLDFFIVFRFSLNMGNTAARDSMSSNSFTRPLYGNTNANNSSSSYNFANSLNIRPVSRGAALLSNNTTSFGPDQSSLSNVCFFSLSWGFSCNFELNVIVLSCFIFLRRSLFDLSMLTVLAHVLDCPQRRIRIPTLTTTTQAATPLFRPTVHLAIVR
jgi:hypothetical protein